MLIRMAKIEISSNGNAGENAEPLAARLSAGNVNDAVTLENSLVGSQTTTLV